MSNVPISADLSKLANVLKGAKQVMNKVNTGDYQTGNVDGTSLVQNTDGYVENVSMTESAGSRGMTNSTRKMGNISQEAIANSNLPEPIKKAMMENPIPQATINHTFNLEDVSNLIADEKPMPAPKARPTRQVNENTIMSDNSGMITVSEETLKGMIKDVLIEYLTTDYNKTLTENTIKKTINTLIKEGKIKTKSK